MIGKVVLRKTSKKASIDDFTKPLKKRSYFRLTLSEPLVIKLHNIPKMYELQVVQKKRTYQKSISVPIAPVLPYNSLTVVYTDTQMSGDCSMHPLPDGEDAFNLGLFFNLQELVNDSNLNVLVI